MTKVRSANDYLLPWYVNGTLSESEMVVMEKYLAIDSSGDAKIKDEMQLSRCFHHREAELDELQAQQDFGFSLLQQRLRSDQAQLQNNVAQINNQPKPKLKQASAYKLTSGLAVAASFIVALVVYWSVTVPLTENGSDYRVLSNVPTEPGYVMQLIFSDDVDGPTATRLLQSRELELINGPSANGVYRVRLKQKSDIEYWQQHALVRWAEVEIH